MDNEQNERRRPVKAYLNEGFLKSASARALRILSEYLEPRGRFAHYRIDDTIVFLGSARILSREQAERHLKNAQSRGADVEAAQRSVDLSHFNRG